MTARVTIHDVARAAGVSVATVSKAVNGRYGVSAQAIERVMAAVDGLGYESSLVASSMRARRTGVIGVLVADFEPFSSEVLKGVGAAVRSRVRRLLAMATELGVATVAATTDLSPDPALGTFQAAAAMPAGPFDQQRVLDGRTVGQRLDLLEALVAEQAEVLEARLRMG